MLLASCASTPPTPTGSEAPPQLEAGKTITVRYCNDQTAASTAPEHFDGEAPVAVYVHGGSWIDGDHDTGGFIINQIGPALTEDGFVVANVNYPAWSRPLLAGPDRRRYVRRALPAG